MKSQRLLALVLLALPCESAGEEPARPSFVIVQPGYPGNTKDAEAFIRKLSAFVEEKAGLRGLSGEYHNEVKPALAAIEKLKPAFAVVSLGFYLEQRKTLGLKSLLASKPRDNFILVAREGDLTAKNDALVDPNALKGQAVAGGPLHDAAFLGRIAFAGKVEVSGWDSRPVLHASRALRDLVDRKLYKAVVLTGKDYRALAPLYQTKKLEKVLESEYYPPAFLVALEAVSSKERPEDPASSEEIARKELRRKLTSAFSVLPRDPKGKEILETMGAEGFEEIQPGWLTELEGKHDARAEKK